MMVWEDIVKCEVKLFKMSYTEQLEDVFLKRLHKQGFEHLMKKFMGW